MDGSILLSLVKNTAASAEIVSDQSGMTGSNLIANTLELKQSMENQ